MNANEARQYLRKCLQIEENDLSVSDQELVTRTAAAIKLRERSIKELELVTRNMREAVPVLVEAIFEAMKQFSR